MLMCRRQSSSSLIAFARSIRTGPIGDFMCHIMDTPFKALELTAPTSVQATSIKASTTARFERVMVDKIRFMTDVPVWLAVAVKIGISFPNIEAYSIEIE